MKKLLWIDMEMTGLDVEHEVIIEVAAIVTDMEFRELDHFESVIKQPQKYLDDMDEWNTEHHTKSGLVAKIPFGSDPEVVEDRLIEFVKKNFPDPRERPTLSGNSIHQDRLFIEKHMPRFAERLHYRMLDVSSWKIIFREKLGFKYSKQNNHRALDDVRESIEELRAYLRYVTPPPQDDTSETHEL